MATAMGGAELYAARRTPLTVLAALTVGLALDLAELIDANIKRPES